MATGRTEESAVQMTIGRTGEQTIRWNHRQNWRKDNKDGDIQNWRIGTVVCTDDDRQNRE
jgi:hypothetical protein